MGETERSHRVTGSLIERRKETIKKGKKQRYKRQKEGVRYEKN